MANFFVIAILLLFGTNVWALKAPTNLEAVAFSTSRIDLTFNDTNSKEMSYIIERSLSQSSGFTEIARIKRNTTTFSSTGLSANTTYYYRVRAYGFKKVKRVYSFYSNVASARTLSTPTPPPPQYTYEYVIGEWSACSVNACGLQGTQSRSVVCTRNDGVAVADSYCSGPKPATSRACSTPPCESGPTPPYDPAQGREIFVSTSGSDTNGNGSFTSPYRTLRYVLSTSNGIVQHGDTITIRGPSGNNTYNECDVRLRWRLLMRSYQGERAHIHCDINTPDSVTIQIDPGASGSKLSNIEISGGRYYGVMMQTHWYQGGPESNKGASNIVLEYLYIHDTGRDAIKITPKSNYVTIRRSEIARSGAIYPAGTPVDNKNAEGIDNVNGSYMVVEDNYIHDTATTGVYFKGGSTGSVVQRNVIENTGSAGILVGFDTSVEFFDLETNPGYYEAIDGVIKNNIIRNTRYSGIGMYASRNTKVYNNTIINAAQAGHAAIYFGVTFQDWDPNAGRPANINPSIRNNLVLQPSGRACVAIRYSNELGGLSGLSGSPNMNYNAYSNVNGSCTFSDNRPGSNLSSGSFEQWQSHVSGEANSFVSNITLLSNGRLPSGSPVIDRGQSLSEVVLDIDGDSRVAHDIGADEY